MKSLIGASLAALALVATSLPSQAADIPPPVYKSARPVYSPSYNWGGMYVGGDIGYGVGKSNWSNIVDGANFAFSGAHLSQSPKGFLGGAHLGYNWQAGSFVFGAEAAYTYMGLKATGMDIDIPASGTGDSFESRVKGVASATGRLGYAWDRVLFYGKGGYAMAQLQINAHDTISGATFSSSKNKGGWTLGGGLEYGITQNWVAGIEYDYYNFGATTMAGSASNAIPFSASVKTQINAILARLSYKFGG